MNVQYKKGVLELCVLAMLYKKECYGYDVSEYISQRVDISDGTVYPILRKLKNDGLVTTYISEASGGPPRKYYKITELGRQQYVSDKNEWTAFIKIIDNMLEENDNEKK